MKTYQINKEYEKCRVILSVSEFDKSKSYPDGRASICKWCNGTKFNSLNISTKRKPIDNEKARAHQAVSNAVFQGKLPHIHSCACDNCGEQAGHYHHESYEKDKRLDVVPMCASCHKNLHMEQS